MARNQAAFAAAPQASQGWTPLARRPELSARHHFCAAHRDGVEPITGRTWLWQRGHLLAPVSGLDSIRGLATAAQTFAGTSQRARPDRSLQGSYRLLLGACGFWGTHTGPNPTDRAKKGVKRHIITEAGGLPVVIKTTPANHRDDKPTLPMLQSIPVIRGHVGRPRIKPGALYGDRGYGFKHVIAAVAALGVIAKLARRGSEHGSGLGKVRYVVERTFAWFDNWRRLRMCYEKSNAHYLAFNQLAACLICHRRLAKVSAQL